GVLHATHDETVEQRHLAASAGARLDAAAGQEAKTGEHRVKAACPGLAILRFRPRQCPGDPPPGVVDGLVDDPLAVTETVTSVPDVARDLAPEHVVARPRRSAHGTVRVNPSRTRAARVAPPFARAQPARRRRPPR